MEDSSSDSSAETWQRYKAWLIEHTANTEHPAAPETLQRMYDNDVGMSLWNFHSRWQARAWMLNEIAPGYLAVNRFNRQESIDFVDDLYAVGAKAVYVTDLDIRRQYFAPHSDTLIVVMPDDPQQRRALLDVHEAENYDAPDQPVEDTGTNEIGFWWD